MTKRLLFLALLLSTSVLAQSVGCGGVPGAAKQTPRNGCGGIPSGGSALAPIDGWPMDEGSGDTLHTTSSTGNNLTAANITWASSTGFPGTVPNFDGSTSYAVGANQTTTNFDGTTPFSVCGWYDYTNASTVGALIGTLNASSGNYTGWELSVVVSGTIQVLLINDYPSNAIAIATASPTFPGVLNHACFTYDGSQEAAGVIIYVNGSVAPSSATINTLSTSIANSNVVQVGRRIDGSTFFGGALGDFRIYNIALTPAQVAALYGAGPQ